MFVIAAHPDSGLAVIDGPELLVDKRTGKLTEVYGLVGRQRAPGLVPIGNRRRLGVDMADRRLEQPPSGSCGDHAATGARVNGTRLPLTA